MPLAPDSDILHPGVVNCQKFSILRPLHLSPSSFSLCGEDHHVDARTSSAWRSMSPSASFRRHDWKADKIPFVLVNVSGDFNEGLARSAFPPPISLGG